MGQLGWDKAATPQGGTMPATMQRIIAAMYTNAGTAPIVDGGQVSGRSDLTYAYTGGVGVVTTPAGAAMVTWEPGTTALVGQPPTTRTDVIYATSSGVFVAAGGSGVPAGACILDKRSLPGGSTQTSKSSSVWNKNFAMPYGASRGWLATYGEYRVGGVPKAETMYNGTFWVPTDRLIDLYIEQGIFGVGGNGTGWVRYAVIIDGALVQTFEIPYTGGYAVGQRNLWAIAASAGEHRVEVKRLNWVGANATFFGGGSEKLSGGFVGVRDAGVAQ